MHAQPLVDFGGWTEVAPRPQGNQPSQGHPHPHGPGPHVITPGFEFGPGHNAVIGKTASRMRAFAILSIIFGALQLLGSLAALAVSPAALAQTAGGAVAVAVGIVFFRGSDRLLAVVKTQGDDLGHMMAALTSLGRAFLVQVVAMTIAFFIGAVAAGLVAAGIIGSGA